MRSMTGIGEFRLTEQNYDIHTSIKGVNHRFLQLYIKIPACFTALDDQVRKKISAYIQRGKIDIAIDFINYPVEARVMVLNQNLIQDWLNYAKLVSTQFQVPLGVDAEKILRIPESLIILTDETKLGLTWQMVEKSLDGALTNFIASREDEGTRMRADLEKYGFDLSEIISELPSLAETQVVILRDRLKTNLVKLTANIEYDPQRLEQEIALAAIKADVSEEITRLRSHMVRYQNLIDKKSAIGKELEFMAQEMHREINTIGSKSCDSRLSSRIIDLKVIVEKIREQVQNIE
jgi:uncharacterized protein (TIGR00255 family)